MNAAMLFETPETPISQSLCFADGAIATGTLSFTTRYFQESSNRNLYGIIYQAYCACITVSYTILKYYLLNLGNWCACHP